MSSVILTHVMYCTTQLGRYKGFCEATIQVIFNGTYTICFYERFNCPRQIGGVDYVKRERYIRDIPYFPKAMIDAIKLMNMMGPDSCDPAEREKYTNLCYSDNVITRSPGDYIFDGLSRIFSDNFCQNVKSEESTQKTIKKKFGKTQEESIDMCNDTPTESTGVRLELIESYNNMRSIGFELYDMRNQKNEMHRLLEINLQENEKLMDALKTMEDLNAELREKNLSLSNKLSDTADLYESLLIDSSCSRNELTR